MHRLKWAAIEYVLSRKACEAGRALNDAAFMPLPHFTLAANNAADALLLVGWWRYVWTGC